MDKYSFYARFYLLVFTSRVNKEISSVEKRKSNKKILYYITICSRRAISFVKKIRP